MKDKILETVSGVIHYWINDIRPDRKTLVFLPGLTADHHLFDRQTEAFEKEFNLLAWDAPGHAASRPFRLDFSLMDKAGWLHEILQKEGIAHPILIGQSMGGYVSQCYMQRYPGETAGRTEPMYRAFPWKSLKKIGTQGCAQTEYGRKLMRSFVDSYTKDAYCRLSGHGMKLLAEAMEADLPYVIDCPAVLICGEKDQAGSAKSYNRRWAKKEGLPLYWIRDAGHNSNTDKPEEVNRIIRDFAGSLQEV